MSIGMNGYAYIFHSTGTVDIAGTSCATNLIEFGLQGAASDAGCPSPGAFTDGTLTTGNVLITDEGAEINVS